MYCLRCGYNNNDNATICKNCNTNMIETQNRYNYGTNSCEDQQNYRYKYSYGTNPPATTKNTCEDQQDYRYKYSYGTNPPSTNYNTSDNQYNYSERYLYSNSTETIESNDLINDLIAGDEKYFRAYIGPGFDIIRKQKFSILTALIGPYYFFARRMYLYSLLWILSLVVIQHYQPEISQLCYILINIFMAIKFRNIYISFVDRKIEKIKLQSLDLTTDEIIKKCKQKGNYKIQSPTEPKKQAKNAVIVIIIITMLAVLPTIFETVKTIVEEETYQEYINYSKNLRYNVPSGFRLEYNTELKKIYRYRSDTEFCTITIDKYLDVTKYIDDEEFLHEEKLIPDYIHPKTRLINDQIWYIIGYNETVYYVTSYEKTGYIISTEIIQDTGYKCQILIDEFINSLRIA